MKQNDLIRGIITYTRMMEKYATAPTRLVLVFQELMKCGYSFSEIAEIKQLYEDNK